MSTVNVTVRVNTELKESAEKLFHELGLDMSSAINLFLRSAVNSDGLPFEIPHDIPEPETIVALSEYRKMKKKASEYRRYDSFEELIDEILSDTEASSD